MCTLLAYLAVCTLHRVPGHMCTLHRVAKCPIPSCHQGLTTAGRTSDLHEAPAEHQHACKDLLKCMQPASPCQPVRNQQAPATPCMTCYESPLCARFAIAIGAIVEDIIARQDFHTAFGGAASSPCFPHPNVWVSRTNGGQTCRGPEARTTVKY